MLHFQELYLEEIVVLNNLSHISKFPNNVILIPILFSREQNLHLTTMLAVPLPPFTSFDSV